MNERSNELLLLCKLFVINYSTFKEFYSEIGVRRIFVFQQMYVMHATI